MISEGFGVATESTLNAIKDQLDGNVLRGAFEYFSGQAVSTASETANAMVQIIADQITASHRTANTNPPSRVMVAAGDNSARAFMEVARIQQQQNRQNVAEVQANWEDTPLNRLLATGDPNVLLSQARQYVMSNLLCKET